MNWKLPCILVVIFYATEGYGVGSCAWEQRPNRAVYKTSLSRYWWPGDAALVCSVSLDNGQRDEVCLRPCLSDTF